MSCEVVRFGSVRFRYFDVDNESIDRCLGDCDGFKYSYGLIMFYVSSVIAELLLFFKEWFIFMCNIVVVI